MLIQKQKGEFNQVVRQFLWSKSGKILSTLLMFLEKNEQNQSRNFELESDKADKSIQFLTYLVKK